MLLDNKTKEDSNPVTVYEFITHYLCKAGTFDVVTGYFSVAALARLYDDVNSHISALRLVIGDTAQIEREADKIIDLLTDNLGIEQALRLNTLVPKAVALLDQDKVAVKTLRPNFCHAKAYLYDCHTNDAQHHFYVMGSSNLTEAGLGIKPTSNIELNTASFGGQSDYKELKKWFGELWKKPEARSVIKLDDGTSKDFKQHLIDLMLDLSRKYTPQEVYEKVLYELFRGELEAFSESPELSRDISHLRESEVFKVLLPFQKAGVLSLIRMLQQYNGAILADAVGLGKTWQALAVIKFFEMQGAEVIVLCPKKLENNWQRYLYRRNSRFESDRLDYVVRFHTDLQGDLLEKKADNIKLDYFQSDRPKLLVIDESHNLRNDKSSRYKFLVKQLLEANRNIKVLLLSATPINTALTDVRNQFKLLAGGRNDGFAESLRVPNLQYVFAKAQEQFKIWQERPDPGKRVSEFVKELPEHFFELTDALIVARTRKQIKGRDNGLHFPTKEKPVNLYVGLDRIGDLKGFDTIFRAFRVNMTAYRPSEYTEQKTAGSILEDERQRDKFLVRMMAILLVKRLESCWYSFGLTVNRILAHHENALSKIVAFEKLERSEGRLDLSEDEEKVLAEALDELDAEEYGGADFALGKKRPVALNTLTNLPAFVKHLRMDVTKLRALAGHVKQMTDTVAAEKGPTSVDTKLQRLIEEIKAKRAERTNQKIIIFTAFRDTAQYLFDELGKRGFSRMAMVSGQESKTDDGYLGKDFEPILERFAPFTKLYNERDWRAFYVKNGLSENHKPKYPEWQKLIRAHDAKVTKQLDQPLDLLITTDCLSEGQNLQDGDCVMNYDIHWNPVRLIQRLGRVDRLGSPNESVVGYNFWPAASYDEYLNLRSRVENRMALLSLVGAEFEEELTPDLKARMEGMENTPLATQQADRMMRQMQTTWDDIEENGQTLGLDDFSLEPFRQELFDLLRRSEDKYRRMPNGIYTGFKARPELLPDAGKLPTGIIALLGYPRRPSGAGPEFRYEERHLAYAAPGAATRFVNHKDILSLLSLHQKEPRLVPAAIEQGQEAELQRLANLLDDWLAQRGGRQALSALDNLFTFGTIGNNKGTAPAQSAEQKLLEDKFQKDQFDLICWFAVS